MDAGLLGSGARHPGRHEAYRHLLLKVLLVLFNHVTVATAVGEVATRPRLVPTPPFQITTPPYWPGPLPSTLIFAVLWVFALHQFETPFV